MRQKVFQLLNNIEASYLLLEKTNDFSHMNEFDIVKELTELAEFGYSKKASLTLVKNADLSE